MTGKHSGVYFIRRSGDGAIKIGYSRDVSRRIGQLQTGCPERLTLAGLMVGGTKADEWNLQKRFARIALHGEWFKPEPELLECVAQHDPPEYFNEDLLRAAIKQRGWAWTCASRMAGDPYSGPMPKSFSEMNIPCRIPIRRGLLLVSWATEKDLDAYERELSRKVDAAMARAVRAYPNMPQTEDPALARLVEFKVWAEAIRPVLRAFPDWRAGDALRFLAQQEGASA